MKERSRDIEAIRAPAAAIGALAGFAAAYLTCFFADVAAEPPVIIYGVLIVAMPFIVLGAIISILRIRRPLSAGDARVFVLYLWGPFISLYVATSILYWAMRV